MSNKEEPMYSVREVNGQNIIFAAGPPSNLSDRCIMNTKANSSLATASRFSNVTPNTTVTSGYGESDRDYFRQESVIPTAPTEIIAACMQAYDHFPIVHNIIDMMADFTVKGIDIVNKSPEATKFAKDWFLRINGKDRAERIAHMLYLAGTVPVERIIGKLPEGYKKGESPKLRFANPLPPGKIPIGYNIMDPRNLLVPEQTEASSTVNVSSYAVLSYMQVPTKKGGGPITMPRSWLKDMSTRETQSIKLDDKKHILLFYKREDFEATPKPLTFPMLRTLRTLNKLIACDDAALDGAISKTTVWRIGYINEKDPTLSLFPSESAIARLSEMLAQSPGGGTRDLVWGPELDFKETGTDIHNFLGKEKYIPTLEAINQGYGVPSSLTGGQASSGYTNNFVSLRTLAERLEYGRNIIIAFFEQELEILRDALGFRYPFKVVFDQPTLSDEAAEKKLLLDLVDRGIISEEFIQERFGAIPEIENSRVKREYDNRKSGDMPPKAGPFTLDYQRDANNERAFVQGGILTPSQVGLKYPEPEPNEMAVDGTTSKEIKAGKKIQKPPTKGQATDPMAANPPEAKGRPRSAQDKVKRKKKRVVPFGSGASLAEFSVKVGMAKTVIDEVVKAHYLQSKGKTNLRKLTQEEFNELEDLTFATLYSFSKFDGVNKDTIVDTIANLDKIPEALEQEICAATAKFENPTTDIIRQIKLSVITGYKFGVLNNIGE